MSVQRRSTRDREVRFEYLKGREAIRRLRRKPVAYLPIGSLERHGDHLPMGLDVLKAHAVCCECARKIGGAVLPAHFYAAVHLERRPRRTRLFLDRKRRIERAVREWANVYTNDTAEGHLADVMRNLRMMGVRVLVLYTGHYPDSQKRMVRRLAARFNRPKQGTMKVIPFCEPFLFGAGDHAGLWETSIYMALCPEHVDMASIGPCNYRDHGWREENDPRKGSPEFGRNVVSRIVSHLRKEIDVLLRGTR